MGRRYFLARLALGRSAFQNLEEPQLPRNDAGEAHDGHAHRQSYDSRGRPFSASTNFRNAEMRRAQNTILALVGVVEERRREVAKAELDDLEQRASSRRRIELLRKEHEKGEDLDDALTALQHMLHWLPFMVTARYQSGLYDPRRPLLDQISRSITHSLRIGWKGFISALLPGAVAQFIHTLAGVLLTNLVEVVIDLLQKSVIAKGKLGRKYAKSLYAALDSLWSAALLGIDLALLPLEFYAITQMLGLRPAFPLLPPWQLLSPWGVYSAHRYMWNKPISTPTLRSFCSPAALLLMLRMVYEDSDPSAGVPVCSAFTSFRYPDRIDSDMLESSETASRSKPSRTKSPRFVRDPLGWMLYRGWIFRCRVMRVCGWDVMGHDAVDSVQTEGTTHSVSHDQQYRPTNLARSPMRRLATSIDVMFQAILVLPLHSLAYRSVASTFLEAVSVRSASSTGTVYPISSGGPVLAMIHYQGSHEALAYLGSYVSKIGLGLAMHSLVDLSIVGLAYYTAQRYGRRDYGWGKSDRRKSIE